MNANSICIKGVIAVPEVSHDGDLQNLAQSFKNSLDLYANVVKVTVLKFLDVASIFTPSVPLCPRFEVCRGSNHGTKT